MNTFVKFGAPNVVLILVGLLAPTGIGSRQDSGVQDSAQVEAWIGDVTSGDPDRIARGRAALVETPDAALPLLQQRYTALEAREEPEAIPSMIELLATVRTMGPAAARSLEFLAEASEHVESKTWNTWIPDDGVESRGSLSREVARTLGATGREGLQQLLDLALENQQLPSGWSYKRVLWTLEPEGAESLEVVAEWALSSSPAVQELAWVVLRNAERGAVPHLVPHLEDKDPLIRRRAARALSHTLPDGIPALCAALASDHLDVRRLAISGLAAHSNTHRSGTDSDRHTNLTRRSKHTRILPRLLSPDVQGALGSALSDADPEVRTMAAFVLYRLAPTEPGAREAALPALEAALRDPFAGVRYWAGEALHARAPLDARWIQALAEATPLRGEVSAPVSELAVQVMEDPAGFIASRPPFEPRDYRAKYTPEEWSTIQSIMQRLEDRIEAVRLVARRELPSLLKAVESKSLSNSGPPLERLLAMESERAHYAGRLGFHLEASSALHWEGWILSETSRLCSAMLPELTNAFLMEIRFPIGYFAFDDFRTVTESCGDTAFRVFAEGLWHWHDSGRAVAQAWLGEHRTHPDVVMPLWISELRSRLSDSAELSEWVLYVDSQSHLGNKNHRHDRFPAAIGGMSMIEPLLDDPAPDLSHIAALCIRAASDASASHGDQEPSPPVKRRK